MNLYDEFILSCIIAFKLQCTGIAVFKDNDTVDCTFLNTNAETIGTTDTYLPTPLKDKGDFTFYLNTAREGKGNNFSQYHKIIP